MTLSCFQDCRLPLNVYNFSSISNFIDVSILQVKFTTTISTMTYQITYVTLEQAMGTDPTQASNQDPPYAKPTLGGTTEHLDQSGVLVATGLPRVIPQVSNRQSVR